MGTQTLEKQLIVGLHRIIVPAMVALATAAIFLAVRVESASAREIVRARANQALHVFEAELAEGDGIEEVLAVSLGPVVGSGMSGCVRRSGSEWTSVGRPFPPSLKTVKPGECREAVDDSRTMWLACGVNEGPVEVIVAAPDPTHSNLSLKLGLGMLAVVAIMLAAVFRLVRSAVRRPLQSLQELAEWAEQVVEERRPLSRPTVETVEFERLASAFENLVQRLFAVLERERASSAQIAHELRTPLAAMHAELEALASRDPTGQRLLADAARLERVVDTVLLLSRPTPPQTPETIVNLADLAREMAAPGMQVEAPDEALVEGDAHLLRLALCNLLENAERHGGHPASRIRITRDEKYLHLTVCDGGRGIHEDGLARMFDRHWRWGEHAGSGLGLALVKAVCEYHGGRAEAHRGRDDKGLEVVMILGRVRGWHESSDLHGIE